MLAFLPHPPALSPTNQRGGARLQVVYPTPQPPVRFIREGESPE